MRVDPLGDQALILRDLGTPAHDLARWLDRRGIKGVQEAVASYDTVGVYFDWTVFEQQTLEDEVAAYEPPDLSVPRRHEIPVCYEMGDDLMEVANRLRISPIQVVHLHCGQPYTCFAVGFCPGFPYLGYLPEGLSGVPRRDEPRLRVQPGSIGITGNQTGIYPLERPGGWALIGRTPLEIVNVEEGYFPIAAGDEIAFVPIPESEFQPLEGKRL